MEGAPRCEMGHIWPIYGVLQRSRAAKSRLAPSSSAQYQYYGQCGAWGRGGARGCPKIGPARG